MNLPDDKQNGRGEYSTRRLVLEAWDRLNGTKPGTHD
jgi:hypothetical protein